MKNSNTIARNFGLRRSLFLLLSPMVGIGGYVINAQKNNVRSLDDIVLTSINAVQVKNLATESTPDITKNQNTASYFDGANGPKPSNT